MAFGGAMSGGGSVPVGILVAVLLGDQALAVLAAGTAGGTLAGALGSSVSWPVVGRRRAARIAASLAPRSVA